MERDVSRYFSTKDEAERYAGKLSADSYSILACCKVSDAKNKGLQVDPTVNNSYWLVLAKK